MQTLPVCVDHRQTATSWAEPLLGAGSASRPRCFLLRTSGMGAGGTAGSAPIRHPTRHAPPRRPQAHHFSVPKKHTIVKSFATLPENCWRRLGILIRRCLQKNNQAGDHDKVPSKSSRIPTNWVYFFPLACVLL